MKKIILLLSFTIFAFQQKTQWVAPPSADKLKNPVAADENSINAGKLIYSPQCKSCHGSKGKGDGPKAADFDVSVGDFTSENFRSQSDGAIFWKIGEGKKPMPAFKGKLSDDQRWNLVNYIRTLGAIKK
ncbi:MAG: cytochrome c [Bacteroidetes bacterium]|nr:cytochrome c [Bacteroidota bacterium]